MIQTAAKLDLATLVSTFNLSKRLVFYQYRLRTATYIYIYIYIRARESRAIVSLLRCNHHRIVSEEEGEGSANVVACAVGWKDLSAFQTHLVDRLLGLDDDERLSRQLAGGSGSPKL